jgi:RLL motif-containing protein 1
MRRGHENPEVNNAIKILRLLNIEQLRRLQTQINILLVEVQKVTADPKTDLNLGKIGR